MNIDLIDTQIHMYQFRTELVTMSISHRIRIRNIESIINILKYLLYTKST